MDTIVGSNGGETYLVRCCTGKRSQQKCGDVFDFCELSVYDLGHGCESEESDE